MSALLWRHAENWGPSGRCLVGTLGLGIRLLQRGHRDVRLRAVPDHRRRGDGGGGLAGAGLGHGRRGARHRPRGSRCRHPRRCGRTAQVLAGLPHVRRRRLHGRHVLRRGHIGAPVAGPGPPGARQRVLRIRRSVLQQHPPVGVHPQHRRTDLRHRLGHGLPRRPGPPRPPPLHRHQPGGRLVRRGRRGRAALPHRGGARRGVVRGLRTARPLLSLLVHPSRPDPKTQARPRRAGSRDCSAASDSSWPTTAASSVASSGCGARIA